MRAPECLGKILQRAGLLVVFQIAAEHREAIGCVVVPVGRRDAKRAIRVVSGNEQHRNAIGVCVVDAHRSVLDANDAVHRKRHWLAGGLRIAVRHRG